MGGAEARARATGFNWSPTGGIREPEWDKLPGGVWVGLRHFCGDECTHRLHVCGDECTECMPVGASAQSECLCG